MQDFKTLTNEQLESELKISVVKETELKIKILHLLAEVERRRLYSKIYPSLFEYCTRELKYSASSAQRRIDTMRAMRLMPEIEQKLQTGELQLSTVAQAQVFFRQETKQGKTYSLEAKRDILLRLENKSSRECERELVKISPQFAKHDLRREIAEDKIEVRMTFSENLIKKLDHLKSLLSHKRPHLSDQELVEILADIALQKLDPAEKRTNKKSTHRSKYKLAQKLKSTTRYISVPLKHLVWIRDKGTCTHPGCGSKHKLQYDHIIPIAKGGVTSAQNLRLLCQTHNLLAAQKEFGVAKMSDYLG